MAKKKSSKAPVKKERPKLETVFACPLCGGGESVTCNIDRQRKIGTVSCSECNEKYQVEDITPLHEAVDIYAAWIDACEEADS